MSVQSRVTPGDGMAKLQDADDDEAPELVPDDGAEAAAAPGNASSSSSRPLLPHPAAADPVSSASTPSSTKKVPVTIITGFLGSGKTTLVQNILTTFHSHKIAVILNEFGDSSSIEAPPATAPSANANQIIKSNTEWLQLANGCLCCTVKDMGITAIENLMSLHNVVFDYILLESTGLADPAPIAAMFWLDEGLNSRIYLDAVVTIVDAKYGYRYIVEEGPLAHVGMNEATRQVALADRLVVNKVDLVSPHELERVVQAVKSINAVAPVVTSVRSQVDLDFILGLNAFDGRQLPVELVGEDDHDHDHHDHTHSKPDAVTTLSFTYSPPVPQFALEKFLQRILWDKTTSIPSSPVTESNMTKENDIEVLRLKGVIHSLEAPNERTILQAVRELYDLNDGGPWNDAADTGGVKQERKSKIVLIGRGLDKHQLLTLLQYFIKIASV
ncbi:hypothetical protein SeLEV6574_g02278 [Synchytrium endobioticum]|nr:hypothetical protein SeLEV6574_g02278 [Synchytrium endobioticum]